MSPRIFRWSWIIVWTEVLSQKSELLLMLRWSASFSMEIRLTITIGYGYPWAALLSVAMIFGLPALGKSRTLALPSLKSRFHFRTAESLMAWLPYTLRIRPWIWETDSPCIEKKSYDQAFRLSAGRWRFLVRQVQYEMRLLFYLLHFLKKMKYALKTNVWWSEGCEFYSEKNTYVDTAYFLLWLSGTYLLNAPM